MAAVITTSASLFASEEGPSVTMPRVRRNDGGTVQLLTWPPTLLPDHDPDHASLHAKCAVADHDVAFVTSANLTSHALNRNMELGLLITGGEVPKRLADHVDGLVATDVLVPWTK